MNKLRASLPRDEVKLSNPSKAKLELLQTKQRKWGLGTNSGRYANHVYQVFNDPDFDNDIQLLRNTLENLYYKNVSLKTDAEDDHLLLIDKELIRDLADKYFITLDDLGTYADGYYAIGYNFGKDINEFGGILTTTSDYLLNYVIASKTTLQQIIDDWPLIKELREILVPYAASETKSKSPQYPELIYAIFKARIFTKLTYRKIFELYEAGDLGNSNTTQFTSEDSLERYYRKYSPVPKANIIKKIRY